MSTELQIEFANLNFDLHVIENQLVKSKVEYTKDCLDKTYQLIDMSVNSSKIKNYLSVISYVRQVSQYLYLLTNTMSSEHKYKSLDALKRIKVSLDKSSNFNITNSAQLF